MRSKSILQTDFFFSQNKPPFWDYRLDYKQLYVMNNISNQVIFFSHLFSLLGVNTSSYQDHFLWTFCRWLSWQSDKFQCVDRLLIFWIVLPRRRSKQQIWQEIVHLELSATWNTLIRRLQPYYSRTSPYGHPTTVDTFLPTSLVFPTQEAMVHRYIYGPVSHFLLRVWTSRYCGHFLSGPELSTLARFYCTWFRNCQNWSSFVE